MISNYPPERQIPPAELHARTFYPLASHRSQVIQAGRYVEALRWMRNRADEKRIEALSRGVSA